MLTERSKPLYTSRSPGVHEAGKQEACNLAEGLGCDKWSGALYTNEVDRPILRDAIRY